MPKKFSPIPIIVQGHNKNTLRITETALMLGLATALSLIKLGSPFGGSVTPASMLPVIVIAYRYGSRWGTISSLTYGLLQLLVGLNSVRGVSVGTFFGTLALDYLLAFGVCAISGLFRNIREQKLGLTLAVIASCIGRFLCHFASGVLLWSEYAPDGVSVWYYSLTYNGSYMLPETIVTAIAAFLISIALDFRMQDITSRT